MKVEYLKFPLRETLYILDARSSREFGVHYTDCCFNIKATWDSDEIKIDRKHRQWCRRRRQRRRQRLPTAAAIAGNGCNLIFMPQRKCVHSIDFGFSMFSCCLPALYRYLFLIVHFRSILFSFIFSMCILGKRLLLSFRHFSWLVFMFCHYRSAVCDFLYRLVSLFISLDVQHG